MSFFKDFKEDLSQAVNELLPGEEMTENVQPGQSDLLVNTLEQEVDVESELKKLEGLFEKVEKTPPIEEPVILTPEEPDLPEIKLEDVIQENEEETIVDTDERKPKEENI